MKSSIVIAPRERFSSIVGCLESLFATIDDAVPVIVVEGATPAATRRQLTRIRQRRPFDWVALDHFVTPHEARNIGFERVQTEFVVLSDNDICFEPGWLEALEENAQRHAADVVAPLICIGPPRATRIHHAGGNLFLKAGQRAPRVFERHRLMNEPMEKLADALPGTDNEVAEFHCFLARAEFIRRIGPLDERLITREQMDLALRAKAFGGRVTFEPGAVVTYMATERFERRDLVYHLFRWSHDLARRSLDAFEETWGLETERARVLFDWIGGHRRRAVASAFPRAVAALGESAFHQKFGNRLQARLIERALSTRRTMAEPAVPAPPGQEARAALIRDGVRRPVGAPAVHQRPEIVAGMATMPSRRESLPQALESILPQVDRLVLFLDGFPDTAGLDHPKIEILRSQEFGDLHADGKLLGMGRCGPGTLYLACDDDVLYPSDYAARMMEYAERFPRAAVGVHGSSLLDPLESYLQDRRILPRWAALDACGEVDILGTCTVAFRVGLLPFDVRRWQRRNMVDLHFSLECEALGIPRVVVAREEQWIRPLREDQADSIFRRLRRDDTEQTEMARVLQRMMRVRRGARRAGPRAAAPA